MTITLVLVLFEREMILHCDLLCVCLLYMQKEGVSECWRFNAMSATSAILMAMQKEGAFTLSLFIPYAYKAFFFLA